ncbi:MAG: type II secretion system protein [Phycisphaerales bacterium JB054]
MHRNAKTTRHHGFTLIELLISVLIIGILIGLLLVGIRQAVSAANKTAGTQDMNSLNIAIQTFKNDWGFLPPLVKDGYAGTPGAGQDPLVRVGSGRNLHYNPNVYDLSNTVDLEFLQDDSDPDYRFSVHSLAYYIMGALGEEADYIEGPGAKAPLPDGSFNQLTNKTYEPLFDPKTGKISQTSSDPTEGRIVLQDARGNAYRYYRWEHATPSTPGYNANDPIANVRLPNIFGSARLPGVSPASENMELRNAEYAIVAAGRDGVFGDIPVESKASIEEALGKSFGSPEEAEDAARQDNIVEVGR